MNKIPFLLLGDGPAEPTGLGRIARDLASQILTSDLPLDLVQVGGSTPPVWTSWRHVPLDREVDWGVKNVEAIYRSIWGDTPGVLFAVWDPARLYAYANIDLPIQKWAYTAIDGANVNGMISGPAGEAVRAFDRVLAYGQYGAEVLKRTLGREVQWLPHGISTSTYSTSSTEYSTFARKKLGAHAIGKTVLGCVMTNQPRKDHALLFECAQNLLARGYPIYVWLHTDELVKDWAIVQLVEDFGLQKRVTITGLGEALSDAEMAALYQACEVTLLPSLGEGFGYPIVESLAAGRPCVHSQCAGGEGFIPRIKMLRPQDVAEAVVWVAGRPPNVDVDWLRLGPA